MQGRCCVIPDTKMEYIQKINDRNSLNSMIAKIRDSKFSEKFSLTPQTLENLHPLMGFPNSHSNASSDQGQPFEALIQHHPTCTFYNKTIYCQQPHQEDCTCLPLEEGLLSEQEALTDLKKRFPLVLPLICKIYNFNQHPDSRGPDFISLDDYRKIE